MKPTKLLLFVKPLKYFGTDLEINNNTIVYKQGIIFKQIDHVNLSDIVHVKTSYNLLNLLSGTANLAIGTADDSIGEIKIEYYPRRVINEIVKQINETKRERGVYNYG